MQRFIHDLRFAVRAILRRPAFAGGVVLTLALGLGSTTAIAGLLDAVLLRPVPVAHPEQVVAVYQATSPTVRDGGFAIPLLASLRRSTRTLSDMAGIISHDVGFRARGDANPVTAAAVSSTYFNLLGLRPQSGRLLDPSDDDAVDAHPVVVLSDALWESEFQRDPGAIGSVVEIGSRPFTVVGVAPAGFRGTRLGSAAQIWVPLTMVTSIGAGPLFSPQHANNLFVSGAGHFLAIVARMRPGVSAPQAMRDLNIAFAALPHARTGPPGQPVDPAPITVVPIAEAAASTERGTLVRFIAMLGAVVMLTLLIACLNVGNLLLIRGTERGRELAIRVAMGASRARLTGALLLESLLLAIAGTLVGLIVASATTRLLEAFTLPGAISIQTVHRSFDTRMFLFEVLLALGATLVFGVAPARRASNVDPMTMLKTSGSASRRGPRNALVALQVAMSMTLLVAAGLFVRSLRAGLSTDIGFDPHPVVALSADVSLGALDAASAQRYYDAVLERARSLPSVTDAAIATHVPLAELMSLPVTAGKPDSTSTDASIPVGVSYVSPGYFDVLRVPVLSGRAFAASDRAGTPAVAVLNERAARVFFRGGNPIGQTVSLFGSAAVTVVGVVRDTKYESVRDSTTPVVFLSTAQDGFQGSISVIVRSTAPVAALTELRRAIAAIDSRVPIHDARLVGDQVDAVLMPQRFGSTLLGVFAVVALVVSVIGVYGVVAYAVTQRTPEIGMRMALGAQSHDVVRAVLSRTGAAIGAGLVIGLAGAAAASNALGRFFVGIGTLDAIAFGGATMVFVLAAATACVIPSRRACRIDPAVTIRSS